MKIEIHREKRDVAGDVEMAEAVVELDAIVDVQRVIRHVDVVEVEVAMAIADPAVAPRVCRKAPAAVRNSFREGADRLEGLPRAGFCR